MTYEEYKRKKKQQEKAPEALTPYQKYRAEKGVSTEPTNNNTAASMKSGPVLAPAEAATFQRAQNNFSPVAKMVDDANQATQQELTYRQKYAGMDQTRLREAKSKLTPDSKEYVWLNSYITETMRPEDYARELEETDRKLQQAQTQLHQIYGEGGTDYFTPEEIAQAQQLQDTIKTLTHQKWDLEQQSKYRYLSEAENYAELSKPATTEQKSGYIDALIRNASYHYDLINDLLPRSDLSGKAREDGNFVMAGIWDMQEDNLGYLTANETANYNYLYNTQGEDSAEEYLAYLKNTLSSRAEQYTLAEWQKLAKQLPVQTSIASVPMSLWGGVGMLDALGQKVVQDVSGEYSGPINYSSAAMLPAKAASTIRGTVAQDLADEHGTIQLDEEKHPVLSRVLNGKSWGDVYQLGMSMVDSAAVAALNPVLGTAGTVLLGGNAATQTMLDAVANGASDEQALSMGILSGAFETIFEKFELDHLLGADTNIVKAIINQALSEAVGEGATSISNAVADAFVLGEKSNWQRNIDRYMQENPGMTEAEARKQAFIDAAIQVGWDAVGGLFSGGIMGGGASVAQNVSSRTQQPQNAPQNGANPQAENSQTTQETAAEPAPGSLEWVQELNELGAGKKTTTPEKPRISMADFANQESPVWRNVAYNDDATKASIMQDTHDTMVTEGSVVKVSNEVAGNVDQAYPDLRSMKKKERAPILKSAMTRLKTDLRQFLNGFKNQSFEFDVNGQVLDATLYSTGINEVMEKVTKEKANMLYSTEAIFRNARYLYSTPDYDGNPNVYRWNYFYTPVQIGEATVGVRIAVRDMAQGQNNIPESQIYNWGIKKDAPLGDVQPVVSNSSHGASSDASNNSISETPPVVNTDSSQSTPTESVGAAPAGFDSGESNVAEVLSEAPKVQKAKRSLWSWVKEGVFDKGMVFETLALKTKNRELQAKWNSTRYAQSRAQWLIGNGAENTKSLNAIREEVEKTGKAQQFSEYLYHKHNIDRMQLEGRYKDAKNKPVFGDSVTAEVSQRYVDQYEKENPSFVRLAQDVYAYMNHLRQLMVDNGIISQDTASLWAQMYPHYVPIRRAGKDGRGVDVPLDTGRTGVNAPVKKAKGGSGDILPLFDTMAQRTLQTYTAIARNSFGVELKNALGSVVSKQTQSVDEAISNVDAQEDLLQNGKNGTNPTFTVFENGERVTFEVTQEMYDALKPKSEIMSYTNKVANAVSNFHRGVLTEYNPTFMLTNAIKDVQDVLINSQHPAKTYAKIPQAYVELSRKGKWYKEYVANGGEQNTYFNNETSSFETEDKGLKKLLDMPPLSTISKLNSFIEMAPRLAEYIASREAGSSVDVAMLDAARVTTNFAAGGDLTKLLNRNGATFLNASMQGAVQQVRNIREAKWNGSKGWAGLAARFAIAGLPAMLLNGLIWEDDEDYEELSDYVKDNYYILWKYDDGQFVKIPKGRVVAVIQGAVRQIADTATGNDEADWGRFLDLLVTSLAPNNPLDNNIISPIMQAANNKTWYGEDLVPARLQDLPVAEQYDESTDALSKWLGEKLNISPAKINYLLNQYGGGIADTFLPMLTPEAESGDNSLVGNILAPLKDKFTTDSVMNNQNVSDFYDKLDELTTNAKAGGATVEDQILYKYINSVNSKLRDLYAQKRKVQNGDLPDDEKYAKVRSIQQQIDVAAHAALVACGDPYSADKAGMIASVIGDSFSDLTECWKNGADTTSAAAAIENAYEAYGKMNEVGKARVREEGGRVTDYLAARTSGISHKTFVDLYKTYYSIDNGDENASAKAAQWSYELEKAQERGTITQAQKNALKEEMNFWQMIPAETVRFDELTENGLNADKADFITQLLSEIKPETGRSTVRTIQRITAIAGADDKLSEADQKTAMKSVLDDKGYEKYLRVLALGLDTDDYAASYRAYLDAEGGGKKKRTIAQYQKNLDVSYSVAKKLYEIYCPPSK